MFLYTKVVDYFIIFHIKEKKHIDSYSRIE